MFFGRKQLPDVLFVFTFCWLSTSLMFLSLCWCRSELQTLWFFLFRFRFGTKNIHLVTESAQNMFLTITREISQYFWQRDSTWNDRFHIWLRHRQRKTNRDVEVCVLSLTKTETKKKRNQSSWLKADGARGCGVAALLQGSVTGRVTPLPPLPYTSALTL